MVWRLAFDYSVTAKADTAVDTGTPWQQRLTLQWTQGHCDSKGWHCRGHRDSMTEKTDTTVDIGTHFFSVTSFYSLWLLKSLQVFTSLSKKHEYRSKYSASGGIPREQSNKKAEFSCCFQKLLWVVSCFPFLCSRVMKKVWRSHVNCTQGLIVVHATHVEPPPHPTPPHPMEVIAWERGFWMDSQRKHFPLHYQELNLIDRHSELWQTRHAGFWLKMSRQSQKEPFMSERQSNC